MVWTCLGAIKPKNVANTFSVPIFKKAGHANYWVQKLSADNVVREMLILPDVYLEEMNVVQASTQHAISIESEGLYGFCLGNDAIKIAPRHELEEFLSEYLDALQNDPVARLTTLRFVGCSVEDEKMAVRAVGNLIANDAIREAFVSLEFSTLSESDEEEQIDKLIGELASVGSFAQTHSVVSRIMSLRRHFAPRHFKQAMRAALSNNQVYWISGDADVRDFLDFLIDNGKLKLSADALSRLAN